MRDKRRPFWQPAANYYMLAVAVSVALFFIAWGLLNDAGEESPWIPAGIVASSLLGVSVVMRQVVLRKLDRRLEIARQTDETRAQAAGLRSIKSGPRDGSKLSVDQNSSLLKEIQSKSEAAKLLNRFSVSHREVFEMCTEYLVLNEHELKSVNPNSPRLAPLLRGRNLIAEYQRFHLLKWAEIETRTLTGDAQNLALVADRVSAAQSALAVLHNALQFYPTDTSLIESHSVVTEMLVSIKVRDWTERAERAAFKGDYAQAKSDYEDALFELSSGSVSNSAREEAITRLHGEIDHLHALSQLTGADLGKRDNG